jgi:hypothetical protein
LLYRWYFMILTSAVGACLLTYAILAILHYQESMDAIAWSDDNATLLSALCAGGALAGFLFQFFFDRWRIRKLREAEEDGDEDMISLILSRIGFKRKS